MVPQQTFGAWLRAWRAHLDLTRDELALKIGCSRSTLRMLEGNLRRPSKAMLQRILVVLAIPPEERAHAIALARGAAALPCQSEPAVPGNESAPPVALHPLPTPLTTLFGRDADRHAVLTMLAQPGVRLLTLLGPPGVGKTRLSLACAHVLQQHCAVTFVPLASVTHPAQVLDTMINMLAANQPPYASALDTLVHLLHKQRMVLILDNLEHVIDVAPVLTALLEAAPQVKLLVTSREALCVYGEHLYAVETLPTPEADAPLVNIANSPAVQLFVDRVRATMPSFVVENTNRSAIATLCRLLDGVPLALELAAARARWMPIPTLVAQVSQQLDQLAQHLRDGTARHASMQAALMWSYSRLPVALQHLMHCLSIFVGGATATSLAAVTDCSSSAAAQLAQLQLLVEKSLVQHSLDPDGESRWSMLHVVRLFALEQLHTHAHAEAYYEHYAAHFLAMAECARAALPSAGASRWTAWLTSEHANLRQALDWLVQHNPDQAAQLLQSVGFFWRRRGHMAEAWYWCQLLTQQRDQITPLRYAAILNLQGLLALNCDADNAAAILKQSLRIYQQYDQPEAIGDVLNHLGGLAFNQGNYAEATAYYSESLRIVEQLGQPRRTAILLNNLGCVAYQQGQYAQAQHYFEQSLGYARHLDTPWDCATALGNLGCIYHARGQLSMARQYLEESIALLAVLGDKRLLSTYHEELGRLLLSEGHLNTARQHAWQSLILAHSATVPEMLVRALELWAVLAHASARFHLALRLLSVATFMRTTHKTVMDPPYLLWYQQWVAPLRAQQLHPEHELGVPGLAQVSIEQAVQWIAQELEHDAYTAPVSLPQIATASYASAGGSA